MPSVRSLLVFVCLMVVFRGMAQDSTANPRILLVPFNPDYYFSDADQDIAQYSRKELKDVREDFQAGLNLYLNARIVSYTDFNSKSLLHVDEEVSAEDDLYQIYHGISYRQAKPKTPWLETESTDDAREGLGEKLKHLFKKEDDAEVNPNSGLMEESGDGTYMEAVVNYPEMLQYLAQKYGTQYFLFVNQFELLTHYEHCLDRSVNNFTRTVKVHITLYDASGQILYGNAISMTTDTGSQTVDAIVAENIKPLIDHLVDQLPKIVPETASY